jgi:hypothetical protein
MVIIIFTLDGRFYCFGLYNIKRSNGLSLAVWLTKLSWEWLNIHNCLGDITLWRHSYSADWKGWCCLLVGRYPVRILAGRPDFCLRLLVVVFSLLGRLSGYKRKELAEISSQIPLPPAHISWSFTDQTNSSGNFCDLYSRGTQFEPRPERRPSCPRYFRGLL